MPTQISCGATDCDNNSGGGPVNPNPQCQLDMLRIAPGKMGAAVCFNYTNAPLGQRKMMEGQGVVKVPMAGGIEKPLG